MYRQYEDPRALEKELEKVKAEYDDIVNSGKVNDEDCKYYHEKITDLEERINFAWQDEEYNYERT